MYSGISVYELNLFFDLGEDGCIYICLGKMALVVFVTQCGVCDIWFFSFANQIVNRRICELRYYYNSYFKKIQSVFEIDFSVLIDYSFVSNSSRIISVDHNQITCTVP